MDVVQVLAVWFHTLALVIVMGYYGVLARIAIPALQRSLDGPAQARALVAIERRALPLVLLSVVLLLVTGTYLMFVDPQYGGLGNFFATTWATLLLIKHVVVIAMIGLGVLVDFFVRELGDVADESARRSSMRLARYCAEGATGLGALAILLTAAAQLAA